MERPQKRRANGAMSRTVSWSDMSPCQHGLADALRRAFVLPADDSERQFDELLRRLA